MSLHNYPGASAGSIHTLIYPSSHDATVTGSSIDVSGHAFSGNVSFTQAIGAVTGSITGKIQTSADDSEWVDIASFTAVDHAGENATERKVVPATAVRKYVRYVGTIVTGPALACVTMSGVPASV